MMMITRTAIDLTTGGVLASGERGRRGPDEFVDVTAVQVTES